MESVEKYVTNHVNINLDIESIDTYVTNHVKSKGDIELIDTVVSQAHSLRSNPRGQRSKINKNYKYLKQ